MLFRSRQAPDSAAAVVQEPALSTSALLTRGWVALGEGDGCHYTVSRVTQAPCKLMSEGGN